MTLKIIECTFPQRLLCINIVRDQCQIDGDYTAESHGQEKNDMGWGLENGTVTLMTAHNYLLLQFQRINAPLWPPWAPACR